MAIGKEKIFVNHCKRGESGGFKMEQKLLGLMGRWKGPWPFVRWQN